MKKVLIVDDYEDIHHILKFVLEDEAIQVRSVLDPDLLMGSLLEWRPDLVLMDVKLGDEDGRELCDNIKSDPIFSDLKIILMSALSESWRDERCTADAKIDKPFEIDDVRELVLGMLANSDT